MKKKIFLVLLCLFLLTGCDLFKEDNMEDIEIITSNYSLEYVISSLYSDYSEIHSIYPDATDIDSYKFTTKQNKDNSKKDLFIYMGANSKDLDMAKTYVDLNNNIKLINATDGMKYINSIDELWLNPSNLLMISSNIKQSLVGANGYISSRLLIDSINENYKKLQQDLSKLDYDMLSTVTNARSKVIFTNSYALKYLEKYGLTVYVLVEDDQYYNKNMNLLTSAIADNSIKNFFVYENTEVSKELDELLTSKNINRETFRNLKNITDSERTESYNYLEISRENIKSISKEIYK